MSRSVKIFAGSALATALATVPALSEPLGLGRAAMPDEIAAWDRTVMPDGRGLPEGGGNVFDGEDLWVDYCAACHGDFGEGMGNWPVIAGGRNTLTHDSPKKTVGSYWPYLSTVWDYTNRSMPFGAAQTLTSDEVYAIVAYILYSNDLVDDDFELTHENFTEIELPNEAGFYEDDRDDTEVPLFSGDPCMSDCRDPVQVTFRAVLLDVTPDDPAGARARAEMMGETVDHGDHDEEAATPETTREEEVQTASLDPAQVAAGAALFPRQCGTCHQVGDGARNGAGPALNGIIGATAGHADGFRYSPAITGAADDGLVWDADALHAFLEDPRSYLPRNRMSYRGMSNADDRAAIIAYLASYSD